MSPSVARRSTDGEVVVGYFGTPHFRRSADRLDESKGKVRNAYKLCREILSELVRIIITPRRDFILQICINVLLELVVQGTQYIAKVGV